MSEYKTIMIVKVEHQEKTGSDYPEGSDTRNFKSEKAFKIREEELNDLDSLRYRVKMWLLQRGSRGLYIVNKAGC